jgi:hypothetical protein
MLPAATLAASSTDSPAADSTSAIARFERTLRGKPMASNNLKVFGAYAQPKAVALSMREIAPDPAGWIRSIRHDVDRADSLEHIAMLVEDGSLPEPSWIIVRPSNGHAHVIWDLGYWVRRDRPKMLGLFERVREAMRRIVDGDQNYVGRFQHNPLHPDFERWGSGRRWELGELVDAIGAEVWKTQPYPSRSKVDPITASLGRNCSTFENVRVAAYAIVEQYRRRGDEAGFSQHVDQLIHHENDALHSPLDGKECSRIGRSITAWTWNIYRRGNGAAAARRTASDRSRAEYLSAAEAARTEARRLRSDGLGATEIARCMNRSRSWVYIALSEAIPSVQSPPSIRACAGSGHSAISIPPIGDAQDQHSAVLHAIQSAPFSDSQAPRRRFHVVQFLDVTDSAHAKPLNPVNNCGSVVFRKPFEIAHRAFREVGSHGLGVRPGILGLSIAGPHSDDFSKARNSIAPLPIAREKLEAQFLADVADRETRTVVVDLRDRGQVDGIGLDFLGEHGDEQRDVAGNRGIDRFGRDFDRSADRQRGRQGFDGVPGVRNAFEGVVNRHADRFPAAAPVSAAAKPTGIAYVRQRCRELSSSEG